VNLNDSVRIFHRFIYICAMIGSTKKPLKPDSTSDNAVNRVSKGSTLEGVLRSENNVRIDGTFEGELITKGRLVVGASGKIKGTINCSHCETEGELEGTIVVQELLVLKSTAKVHGDIQYGQLSVEHGAVATGNLHLTSKVKDIKDANRDKPGATVGKPPVSKTPQQTAAV